MCQEISDDRDQLVALFGFSPVGKKCVTLSASHIWKSVGLHSLSSGKHDLMQRYFLTSQFQSPSSSALILWTLLYQSCQRLIFQISHLHNCVRIEIIIHGVLVGFGRSGMEKKLYISIVSGIRAIVKKQRVVILDCKYM